MFMTNFAIREFIWGKTLILDAGLTQHVPFQLCLQSSYVVCGFKSRILMKLDFGMMLKEDRQIKIFLTSSGEYFLDTFI